MVNGACARDFPAYSFGDLVTAVSTVQSCVQSETRGSDWRWRPKTGSSDIELVL